MNTVQHIVVKSDYIGQRLDNFLIRELKGVPKTHIYRIIRSGEVRLNKCRVKSSSRLGVGDIVRLPPIRTTKPSVHSQQTLKHTKHLPTLFEDDHMMVINKPAGLAVHGGSHLNYGLIEQLRQSRSNSGYLELVHRLDRGTSGILIIAKKASTLKNLQQQFATRQPQKTYLSLVKGKWNHTGQTVINKPLYKYLTPSGERRVTVVQQQDPKGKKAVTLVQPLQGLEIPYIGGCTLLQVVIKTGRTHQIRVHLAHQGYPILGDEKYGDFTLNRALQKGGYSYFGLHAWRLQVIHPNTREPLSLLAPLPQKWYPGIRSL